MWRACNAHERLLSLDEGGHERIRFGARTISLQAVEERRAVARAADGLFDG